MHLTPQTRAALDAYMTDHRRGRHSTVEYDLADLGLDPAERHHALSAYRDRFGLPKEAP